MVLGFGTGCSICTDLAEHWILSREKIDFESLTGELLAAIKSMVLGFGTGCSICTDLAEHWILSREKIDLGSLTGELLV